MELETALNQEADRQTKELKFDSNRISKVMTEIEEKHNA